MSFLSPDQLQELVLFATLSDKEIRSDLAKGFIKDENDYTSNFTSALRRNINSYSTSGLSATSFLLAHGEERECGADATIVLSSGDQSKIAVFEGKWPRFKTQGYRWDYEQTATGLSHFSDQIARQTHWNDRFAVFEMFYSEYDLGQNPGFLNPAGSSCVWHDDANAFKHQRNNPDALWTQNELASLLRNKRLDIGRIMMSFGECTKGKPIALAQPAMVAREYRLPANVLSITAAEDENIW